MYCSSCGVAVTQSLSFCNRCGAKLIRSDDGGKSEVKQETLVACMVATFIFGLFGITVLMGVMKAVLNFDFGPILAFASMAFLVMLLLEGVFISLLLRRRRVSEDAGQSKRATKELDAAQTDFIPQERVSVTEHTTRAFDPIYKERTSK